MERPTLPAASREGSKCFGRVVEARRIVGDRDRSRLDVW